MRGMDGSDCGHAALVKPNTYIATPQITAIQRHVPTYVTLPV